MTLHKRIRLFNTKETYPEQDINNDLSQAVVARGTMVFLRGQVSQDLDSRESLQSIQTQLETHDQGNGSHRHDELIVTAATAAGAHQAMGSREARRAS